MSAKLKSRELKYHSVGVFLRGARESTGLTQREVSIKLGYSTSQFISNFERGVALPPLQKMKVLAKLYKLSISELIEAVLDCEKERMSRELGRR